MRHHWNSTHTARTPFMPHSPLMPAHPAFPAYPSLPGSAGASPPPGFPATPWSNPGAMQAYGPGPGPTQAYGPGPAMPATEGTPLSGLAAHGVPVGYSPSGTPMLMAGQAGQLQMPPDIAGMPKMPGPPEGWLSGDVAGGGLFRPTSGVAPFDPSNLVRQYQQQGR